tara:strand:+ start:4424 stop:5644 length:1221 start_codon:yes stop_codon:yes gene_type:complete
MIKEYVLITLRSLKSRKIRSWLTMLGIFIGIAAVVSLISLGQGLEEALTATFSDLGSDILVVQAANSGFGPPGSLAAVPLVEDDLKIVEQSRGVEFAVGRLLRGVTGEFNERTVQNFAISLPEDKEGREFVLRSLNVQVKHGRQLKSGDRFKVVLGNNFLKDDNPFDRLVKIREKVLLDGKKFEVVGIMERISAPFGNDAFIVMEDTLRDLISEQDEIDLIGVQVAKGFENRAVAEEIEKNMRRDRNLDLGEEDFTVETPEQTASTFNSILVIMQALIIGIATISLFVGGIGIMNTMFTSVLERTREIGIMKAIGAKNRDILTFFMIESGFLGMTGGVVGIIMGIFLSETVEIIGKNILGSELLRANFPWYLIVGALIFSFAVGTLSGVVPALQAAKMHPVDALRK